MGVRDWIVVVLVIFVVLWFVGFLIAFIVGDIQCSAAGWDDGTWYVTDTLCKNVITEKLSTIEAGN